VSKNAALQSRFYEADALRRAGDEQGARTGYRAMWHDARREGDEFWACAAAHMLGVSEPMPPAEKRCWHLESLARARRARESWAATFFASIYANLGYCATHQGRTMKALRYYLKAQGATAALADDPYGQNLRVQIAWALDQLRSSAHDQPAGKQ
jgi:hypothetical protein